MAVERFHYDSRLQVRYRIGFNEDDEPIYRLRTLGRVRHDSDDQALYDVATAIASLQRYELTEVRVADSAELIETAG